MRSPLKVLAVFGTRPEAIKMAPVTRALSAEPEFFDVAVCVTAQHRQMLDQVLDVFEIEPAYDLDLMRPGQSLYDVTSTVLCALGDIYRSFKPNIVLVHGDTTTTMAASLAAYYEKLPIGHVEAGLRTGDIYSPWPEEVNRRITGLMTRLHFAPTEINRRNLEAEGIDPSSIIVTGNTVVDALLHVSAMLDADASWTERIVESLPFTAGSRRLVLVTAHRRENFGAGMENICAALRQLAGRFGDTDFVYPVHPNPNVKDVVNASLGDLPNVHLIEPVDYPTLVYLLKRCTIVLTDSGGLQEEAPGLGKPVLVLRGTTERPEAVHAGTVKLVGTDRQRIFDEAAELLEDPAAYGRMSRAENPYGDGKAAKRIRDALTENAERLA